MRVIVTDDSAVIRAGVARILGNGGLDVVGEAATADEALECVETHRPDLAVLDIRMPPSGNAGLLATEQIRHRYGGATAVLVRSQYLELDYAIRLLGPGTGGVDTWSRSPSQSPLSASTPLGASLPAAQRSTRPSWRSSCAPSGEDRLSALSSRERNVLAMVAEGRSNRSIADRCMVSIKTVEGAIAVAFMKLGLEPDPGDNRRVLAVLAHPEQSH